jgi:hypothetical protein
MKKILFTVLILFTFLTIVSAQKATDSHVFFKLYGNYAVSLASSYRPTNYTTSVDAKDFTYKSTKVGLGKGPRIGIGVGFIVNDFINLGIDVEKYSGRNITSNSLYYFDQNGYTYTSNDDIEFKADMISLIPNITFKAISSPNFFIYNRLGIKAGIINKLEETHSYTNTSIDNATQTESKTTERVEHEYQGGLPIGFVADLGFQVKLNDKFRFFTEIEFSHLTYNPKKKVVTRWVDGGGKDFDLDKDFDVEFLQVEYVKEYTVKDGVRDFKKPRNETTLRIPYSSLGLGIGLIYKL